MKSQRKSPSSKIYQLKITLTGSNPPIWRRVVIPHDLNLGDLHHIIQICMGWCDCHLHVFKHEEKLYSDPKFELNEDPTIKYLDEKKTKLSHIFKKPKDALAYDYDFGDGWRHLVELEKFAKATEDMPDGPSCTEGEFNCPLEDSGGIRRYQEIMKIILDPSHPEHEDLLAWVPLGFDPKYFDLWRVNYVLRLVFGW